MSHLQRRVARSRLLAAVLVVGLVATACGGPSDEAAGTGRAATQEVPCRAGLDLKHLPKAEKPQRGGKLVYGVEAETDGWNPTSSRWALSGQLIATTLYDTLAKPTAAGGFAPYLAKSIEHNADHTVWTITLRSGVRFHDDTPLTAEAAKMSLDAFRKSILTGTSLENIRDVVVTGPLTLEVQMREAWVPFPQILASQVGVVVAPAMFDTDNSGEHPIGTGPFKLDRWIRDKELDVVRNPDYWQKDEFGERLPYLDEIQFVPLPDPASRKQAFDAGDIDVMHTFSAKAITEFRQRAERGEINDYETCAYGEDEEFLLMFNNGTEPFNDPVAREAVVRAIDETAVVHALFGDVFATADGPYAPGSSWYSPPTEAETKVYDKARARTLAEEYEQEHGKPITFTITAPQAVGEAIQAQQLAKQYLSPLGIEVTLSTKEFAQYVLDGVQGNFQAAIWRQYGAADPDGEYVWWHPDNVKPVGQLSLNIARFKDPDLGTALDLGRTSADPVVRKHAYADVQRIFRDNFYLAWIAHAFWAIGADPRVQDLVNWETPDGTQGLPIIGGLHPLAQVWIKSTEG